MPNCVKWGSALHCVRMRTDFSYSNTLGWNTFPVPPLTEQQKADLTECAQNILLAREAHFPATIADLYDPKNDKGGMPDNLRAALAGRMAMCFELTSIRCSLLTRTAIILMGRMSCGPPGYSVPSEVSAFGLC